MAKFLEILDAFSGTANWVRPWWKSVSYNIHIDSVDIQKLPHINYNCDIRDFKVIKEYDIVYASFPCTRFSKLRNCNKRLISDIEFIKAIELGEIAFKLGKKAKLCYIIENPYNSLVIDTFRKYGEPYKVDYSEYDFPMKKRTAIWSNLPLKMKLQKEIKYNNSSLSKLSKINRSAIPLKLSEYVKRVIIKTYNKELQEFKKPFDGKSGYSTQV
jgi:hypothetical protein